MSGLIMFLGNASDAISSGLTAACADACNKNADVGKIFAGVANALIFLVGAVSVIMVIIGGLRYATSNGDSKSTASAKDTILYAVIGVVVAIASFAIVNFVVTKIK